LWFAGNFTANQIIIKMKSNVGSADSMVRIFLALVMAALYFSNIVEGSLANAVLVLGGVFLLTGLFRFCPLYALLGLNTCQMDKK
jgi:hypothetical protein